MRARRLCIGLAVAVSAALLSSSPASAGELTAATTSISWDDLEFVVPKACTGVRIAWNQDVTRDLAFITIRNDKTQKSVMHTLKEPTAGSVTIPLCKEVTDRANKLTIELDLWPTLARPRVKQTATVRLISPSEQRAQQNVKFKNCAALLKRYPNGIAASTQAAEKYAYIRTGFRDFKVDPRLYKNNKRLDPQGLGIICPLKDEVRPANVFADYPLLGALLLPRWKSDVLSWNRLLYGAQVIHVMDDLPYSLINGRITYTPERLENFCWYWESWGRDYARNGILALTWGSKEPADVEWLDENLAPLVQVACADKGYPFSGA